MRSKQDAGALHRPRQAQEASIDRRRFIEGSVLAGVAASLTASTAGQALAAAPTAPDSDRLPDGSAFPRWERPLTFSRTYYVDNAAANADDNGPGDQARPFRTIGKAAQVLQAGERVVIASGIYRECIRPARGGTDPSRMISYEAAPGAKVFVRGSELLKDGWTQETARGRGPQAPQATVWRRQLTTDLFPDLYNLNQFSWIIVQVNHIACLLGCLGSAVHGHAYIRLR